jgi:hypothetical protein
MPVLSRGRLLLIVPVLLSAASAGCIEVAAGEARYVDTVEKRFTVSGTPSLNVRNFDGSIEVSTWDRPEVLVVVEKYAIDQAAADRMTVTTEQSGDRITVDVRQEREPGLHVDFGSRHARITITAPQTAQIDAGTGDGRVEVRDVNGDLRVRTGDGAIRLNHVSGSIEASSGDGSIDVEGAIRGLRLRSGDGRVHIRAAGDSPISEWSLGTGDGSIILEVPEGFNADLDATTGDGGVVIRNVPFSSDSPRSRRRHQVARGRIGDGGPTIRLRTGDGSITVRRAEADGSATQ